MAIYSPYLATDNLHFKPLSARLLRGTAWTTTALQQNASTTEWHGHAVRVTAKVVLYGGIALCITIALVECASFSTLGGVGILLNHFIYNHSSEFLQKHSVKALSYATHSFLVTISSFILALLNPNNGYHTTNALGDHVLHLLSACATQIVVGSLSDRAAGRAPEHAVERTLNLFGDGHPHILNDLLAQLQRDLDANLIERLNEIPSASLYLHRHPELGTFIANLSILSLFRDSAYRLQAVGFIREFFVEIQMIRPNGANPNLMELNHSNLPESAYQDHLVNLLKTSFLEIYRTPYLSRCLDTGEKSGQELLETQAVSIHGKLSAYAQYKELLEPIQCPEVFSHSLVSYNGRHAQLSAAKQLVDALSEDDKLSLEQKVLHGANFEVEAEVEAAYHAIDNLAPALNHGPMMTKPFLNLHHFEWRNLHNILEPRNLFHHACQQAIAEIDAAAAPRPPS